MLCEKGMRVADLMQREVVTLEPEEPLHLAEDIMRLGRIRHFPIVTREGVLVGVVSQRDLYRAGLCSLLATEPAEVAARRAVDVREIMTTNVVTVGQEASARQAVAVLLERNIGCLPVVDDAQRLVGLITETDCLRYLEHLLRLSESRALLPELEPGT